MEITSSLIVISFSYYCFSRWLTTCVTIPSSDLSHIAHLTLLKKLTVGYFSFDNGYFLGNILRKCSMLQSLGLRNIAREGWCYYTENLCAALPMAYNIKLLR